MKKITKCSCLKPRGNDFVTWFWGWRQQVSVKNCFEGIKQTWCMTPGWSLHFHRTGKRHTGLTIGFREKMMCHIKSHGCSFIHPIEKHVLSVNHSLKLMREQNDQALWPHERRQWINK